MIAALNDSWVLCTPTKCGTYSLEASLITRTNLGYKITPRHIVECPEHLKNANRLMIVRNPFSRFRSIFQFLTSFSKRGGVWMSQFTEPEDFVKEFFRRREEEPHWMWTNSMKENCEAFKPHQKYKMEEDALQGIVSMICGWHSIAPVKVSHANTTRGTLSTANFFESLSINTRKQLFRFLRPDAEYLGYPIAESL